MTEIKHILKRLANGEYTIAQAQAKINESQAKLTDDNAKLVDALKFYADPANHEIIHLTQESVGVTVHEDNIGLDKGFIARATLKELGVINDKK